MNRFAVYGRAVRIFVVVFLLSGLAQARHTGMTSTISSLFNPAANGCQVCHTSPVGTAAAPTTLRRVDGLALTTPVSPGDLVHLVVDITPNFTGGLPGAGLNVSTTGNGTFVDTTDTKTDAAITSDPGPPVMTQATHIEKKSVTAQGDKVSFLVDFKVASDQACATAIPLRIWVNNVNNNGSSSGDNPWPVNFSLNAAACGLGTACTTNATCASSHCTNNVCCSVASCTGDQCNTSACGASGQCVNTPKSTSTVCDDGIACTGPVDHCTTSGTCVGFQITCDAPPTCHLATQCSNGQCTYPPMNVNAPCDDHDSTTTGETCDASLQCTGGHPDLGGVYLWGDSTWGEMANGTSGSGQMVRAPLGLTTPGTNNIVALAGGYRHMLALDVSGYVMGWGDNTSGEIGSSPNPTVNGPNTTMAGVAATAIAAGDDISMAINSAGSVFAWGNHFGSTASMIGLSTPAIAIAAGGGHGVVLAADGSVWTFGDNSYGQLGDGTFNGNWRSAVKVTLPRPARAVAAGLSFSVVALADGSVYGWGDNTGKALGQTGAGSFTTPVRVGTLLNVKALAAGQNYVLALLATGVVRAWGDNTYGELGIGTTGGQLTTPTPVTGLSGVVSVAAGTLHSAALKADGTVWTWGGNYEGQLGTPTLPTSGVVATPQRVMGVSNVSALASGYYTLGVITSTGTLTSFGSNSNSQLANGLTNAQMSYSNTALAAVAQTGTTLPPFKAISSGLGQNRVALAADGTVWAWGSNAYGSEGYTGVDAQNPLKVPGISDVISVKSGGGAVMALKADGTLWAWGANTLGILANGTTSTASNPTPAQITSLSNVIAFSVNNSSMAVKADGSLSVWGWNHDFQCGLTSGQTITAPRSLALPAGTSQYARDVSTGIYSDYVLLADGHIASIGRNDVGQLGLGTMGASQSTLQIVHNIANASSVSAGFRHAVALVQGTSLGWGLGTNGQLGPSGQNISSPVVITGLLGGTAGLSAGAYDTYFRLVDGSVYSMGTNGSGALGTGTDAAPNSFPATIVGGTGTIDISGGYAGATVLHQ